MVIKSVRKSLKGLGKLNIIRLPSRNDMTKPITESEVEQVAPNFINKQRGEYAFI